MVKNLRDAFCKIRVNTFLFLSLLANATGTQLQHHLKTRLNDNPETIPNEVGSAKLVLLNEAQYPLAKCMDGSRGGYYYRPADTKTDAWFVHLQGGGECASKSRCNTLKKTALGSSSRFPASHSFRGDNIDVRTGSELGNINYTDVTIVNYQSLLSNNRYENPDFYDWNMVFVPYCSQDLWTGRRTNKDNDTFGVYFSGGYIVEAVIKTLDNEYGMQHATSIIFSGDSAGGYGVLHHVDALAASHPDAKTVGLPIGGLWNYAFPYKGAGHTATIFANFEQANWNRMHEIWQTQVDANCEEAHAGDSAACLVGCSSVPYSWSFVKSRIFIVEAQTDEVILLLHNWVPPPPLGLDGHTDPKKYAPAFKNYVEAFGQNMTQCLKGGLELLSSEGKDNVGIFSPACFIHTHFDNNLQIEGRTLKQAFSDFFYERGPTPKLIEEGFLNNPTCRSQYFTD